MTNGQPGMKQVDILFNVHIRMFYHVLRGWGGEGEGEEGGTQRLFVVRGGVSVRGR